MTIKYPRNNTEAKNFLQNMDRKWVAMLQIKDKRAKSRAWISIAQEMSTMHNKASLSVLEAMTNLNKAKEGYNPITIMKCSTDFNFQKKFLHQVESWMKMKKIPF